MKTRMIAAGLALTCSMGTLAPAAMAKANEKNAHNLALGTTAAAAYLLLHKNTRTAGVITGAGAAYAWKKSKDATKERHQREARYRARHASYNRSHRYHPYR